MLTCIALYRGTKLSDLELVALSTDRRLAGDVAERLLACTNNSKDPAISMRRKGMRNALRIIAREASYE